MADIIKNVTSNQTVFVNLTPLRPTGIIGIVLNANNEVIFAVKSMKFSKPSNTPPSDDVMQIIEDDEKYDLSVTRLPVTPIQEFIEKAREANRTDRADEKKERYIDHALLAYLLEHPLPGLNLGQVR